MAPASRAHRRCRRAAALLAALGTALCGAAAAQQAAPPDAEPAAETAPPPPPTVGLDALLRLPGGPAGAPPAQDLSERQRWEERFREVRGEVDSARQRLSSTQRELEALASKSETWQMTAPGAKVSPETSPISYKLRQDIRDRREELEQAERRLRDLEVEASLAGVPSEWRGAAHEGAPDS